MDGWRDVPCAARAARVLCLGAASSKGSSTVTVYVSALLIAKFEVLKMCWHAVERLTEVERKTRKLMKEVTLELGKGLTLRKRKQGLMRHYA